MIKRYLEYIGLCKNEYPKKRETYTAAGINMAREYLAYLHGINAARDARQNTIETKTSQIIGQSSIVISIVSLFIPLFADKLADLNYFVKWTLLAVFIILVFHFIFATLHALKNLQIEKSQYMEGSTTTVTKDARATNECDFINEQIFDLVRIINHNNPLTNKAAAGLVYASRCFKIGTGTFLIFILTLLICFSTTTKTTDAIRIENIAEMDTTTSTQLSKLQDEIKTLTIQIDSLKSLKSHNELDELKAKIMALESLQQKK